MKKLRNLAVMAITLLSLIGCEKEDRNVGIESQFLY